MGAGAASHAKSTGQKGNRINVQMFDHQWSLPDFRSLKNSGSPICLSLLKGEEIGFFAYELRDALLIVPIVFFRYHDRRYYEPYLDRQLYLNRYQAELMLRNHV
jgi:hypothetical protein